MLEGCEVKDEISIYTTRNYQLNLLSSVWILKDCCLCSVLKILEHLIVVECHGETSNTFMSIAFLVSRVSWW